MTQPLAGVVVAIMYTGGNVLEDYARGRPSETLENFLHLGIDLAPEGGLGLALACGYDERSNFFDAVNVNCDFVGFLITLVEPCRPGDQGWFEGFIEAVEVLAGYLIDLLFRQVRFGCLGSCKTRN